MFKSPGAIDMTCTPLERRREGRKDKRSKGRRDMIQGKGEMWKRSGRRWRRRGGNEGATKILQNPPSPCLSNFLPTFPRPRERTREIRSVVARN